jgi:hypothetical protein
MNIQTATMLRRNYYVTARSVAWLQEKARQRDITVSEMLRRVLDNAREQDEKHQPAQENGR